MNVLVFLFFSSEDLDLLHSYFLYLLKSKNISYRHFLKFKPSMINTYALWYWKNKGFNLSYRLYLCSRTFIFICCCHVNLIHRPKCVWLEYSHVTFEIFESGWKVGFSRSPIHVRYHKWMNSEKKTQTKKNYNKTMKGKYHVKNNYGKLHLSFLSKANSFNCSFNNF